MENLCYKKCNGHQIVAKSNSGCVIYLKDKWPHAKNNLITKCATGLQSIAPLKSSFFDFSNPLLLFVTTNATVINSLHSYKKVTVTIVVTLTCFTPVNS